MKTVTLLYIVNALLLLLHEIESAYEREWEILRLPGGITGFLLIHVPIIFFIFYGLIQIEKESLAGLIFGMVLGIGGVIPAVVHKIFFRAPGRFGLVVSDVIIYLNLLSGTGLFFLSVRIIS